MTRALLLNASPHGVASHAYRIARQMLDGLAHVEVLERDLLAEPVPMIDVEYARAIGGVDTYAPAFAYSERLIVELERTDMLLICTPMHNFTVPASLKLWIDQVLRIHRTFKPSREGKVGLLKDRPTFVLVGSGGFHAGERARQADFLTPYLRYALSTIGIRDVNFALLQGLASGDKAVEAAVAAATREMLQLAPFAAQALARGHLAA